MERVVVMPEVEASFYEKMEEQRVKCWLCPHHCILKEGQSGLCRVRVNKEGTLFSLNYAKVASLALDPIEKKPLYHFFPGSMILSAGTYGCNLFCPYCQNYSLAHEKPPTREISPLLLTEIARQSTADGSIGFAFTYNEPTIWYEYVRDAAYSLKAAGLKSVLVTNGYIERAPLEELLPLVDAMNIDVKAFNDDFYRKHCKGRLEAVKATVERAVEMTHVEITTLLIPGENDEPEEIKALASWLAGLNPQIPLHLSRYHPAFKFSREATPAATLERAREIAREDLDFVYIGNVLQEENNTFCQTCGELLIERNIYQVENRGLRDGKCKACGSNIAYIIMVPGT